MGIHISLKTAGLEGVRTPGEYSHGDTYHSLKTAGLEGVRTPW